MSFGSKLDLMIKTMLYLISFSVSIAAFSNSHHDFNP
jgi:hypothetical protein